MSTMIALVGEQPMPILLPARSLKPQEAILVCTKGAIRGTEHVAKRLMKLIPQSSALIVSPYEFDSTFEKLQDITKDKSDLIFNLTGGTKMMALAAFGLAASQPNSRFIYLQSEGHTSLLFSYRFEAGSPIFEKKERLETQQGDAPLITIADYLKAHLPGFRLEDFSADEGGDFEKRIYSALKDEFEVLTGVRPEGVADQIEIDLVIRCGNQVAIAEIKLGDARGEGPKKGLDQLAMAGRREYLGTYTTKFLITGRQLSQSSRKQIHTLAQDANINIIEPSGKFWDNRRDTKRLVQTVKEKLCSAR